ncbi:glycosyltransferase [Ignatzschineria sp. LJL83]
MKKLLINHFVLDPNFSNGVGNYIKELNGLLDNGYDVINKPYPMNMQEFRRYISNVLKREGASYYDVIECAESQSPSLYLSNEYNVHIRMHCPYFLYKKIIHESPDEARFSDEVRAMYKAKAVSSPSYGMLELLKDELDIDNIHVYKNPIKKQLHLFREKSEKDIDVIFLSRFNDLKGNEFIDELMQKLPSNLNVLIAGKQEQKIKFSRDYSNLTIVDHIEGEGKFDILARSKVAISLSKFENCSMAILEALSVGTSVVAWDVGGNKEMAPPPILRVAPLADIDTLIELIKVAIDTQAKPQHFEDVLDALNLDFISGISHVESYIKGDNSNIYKGISYASFHNDMVTKLGGVPTIVTTKVPINILAVSSTLAMARFFHKNYNNILENTRVSVAYHGSYYSEIKDICDYNISANYSSTSELEGIIKRSKAEVVVLDSEFPLHINDVYLLRKKLNIKILYCEKSILSKHGYTLNQYGFSHLSNIYFSGIKGPDRFVQVENNNVILWANKIKDLMAVDFNKLSILLASYESVDFVGSESLLKEITQKINCKLNYISEAHVSYSHYGTIISISDFMVSEFFDYNNSIFIINNYSVYLNKNIDNNDDILNGGNNRIVNVGSRENAINFIESYECSEKKNAYSLIRNQVLKGDV